MTEYNWAAEWEEEHRWCEKHQIRRYISFAGTAPFLVCQKCDEEFEAKVNAEVDAATN